MQLMLKMVIRNSRIKLEVTTDWFVCLFFVSFFFRSCCYDYYDSSLRRFPHSISTGTSES